MAAKEYKQGTIQGKAFWAKLGEEEVIEGTPTGNYSICLEPSAEEAQRLLNEAQAAWDEYLETPEMQKKRIKGEPFLGNKETDEGNTQFKFKMKTTITKKNGDVIEKVVPIFDGMGRSVSKKLKNIIGNGSTVVVAYQLFPFFKSANSFGISLRLVGVQVLDLVRYSDGGDASSMGFTKHEGSYSSSADLGDDADEDDVPFTDDDSDGADNGDF